MDTKTVLMQLRALRATTGALVQQIDALAAALAQEAQASDAECEHPERDRTACGDFDDPGRFMCGKCDATVAVSPRETASEKG